MLIEKPEELKSWLTRALSKLYDADTGPLARYILALVKKDKSPQALKTFLLEQLEIFLEEDTPSFVELLFDALQKKSYLDVASDEGLSSPVDLGYSSLPTKSNLDVEDPLKEEHGASSSEKIKSTSNSQDVSQSYAKNSESQKRKTEDMLMLTKKVKTSIPHPEETEKNNINDGKFKKVCATSNSSNSVKEIIAGSHSCSKSKEKLVYSTTEQFKHEDSRISKIEPPKSIQKSVLPHGDTDYRQKQPGELATSKIQKESKIAYSTKQSTRCKDYDQKGYCLKGNFCAFDHGKDPILVEHGSALNFGVDLSSDDYEDELNPPFPPLPTSPPPPQPPPPPSDSLIPEPYNPESPGMNMGTLSSRGHNTSLNFYVPTAPLNPFSSQSSPAMEPKVSSVTTSMFWGNAEPSFHHKPKPRIRELIGVTTVDSSSMTLDKGQSKDANNDRSNLKPLGGGFSSSNVRAHTAYLSDFKTKGFNFSRVGPSPRRKCLEIRKIPKALNSITNLHNHFGKFGNIVNIEVGYAGDPEAAKISFSTHGEATAAYRSTEPILNNRFIKVFWNNDSEKETNTHFSKDINVKESLSSVEMNNGALLNNPLDSNKGGLTALDKVSEKSFIPKGNMSRSVYVSNPYLGCKRKINSFHTTGRKGSEKEAIAAHKKKKFELHQAKSVFIQAQIEHQKIILDQLIKAKSQKEKDFLKKTLDTISEQIKDLQSDLKKDTVELKVLLKSSPQDVKTNTKKELLDAELELYKKQQAGSEDVPDLEKKVHQIKNKARTLGLIESAPKIHSNKYVFTRHGNTRYRPASTVSSLSVDHRPKRILVIGSSDKDGLLKHFQKYGKIEKLDEAAGGIVVSFSSRINAEAAFTHGKKFEGAILTLAWFTDTDLEGIPHPDINKENPEVENATIFHEEDMDEDDDEEDEDSKSRPWRR